MTDQSTIKGMTCLDLFCGCGGFSLGMKRAGFRVVAAIDFNEEAVATLKANLGKESQRRDALVNRTLRRAGWKVLRVWEHALERQGVKRLLGRIGKALS